MTGFRRRPQHANRIALFLMLTCAAAPAQQMVKGVPYSATLVHSSSSRTSIQKVARDSNGSLYTEWIDVRPNHGSLISILDIPNHRRISLDPQTKTYSIDLSNVHPLHEGQTDDAQVRERIETLRKLGPTHFSKDGMEGDNVPIGFRTVNGIVEYGTRSTFTKLPTASHMQAKVWETWFAPALYLDAEKTGFDEAGNPIETIQTTELQTTEPDPHLFEIPQDYTPATAHPIR